MQYSGKCNGCGLCCKHPIDGRDCQYLIRLGNGLTKCRVYGNRIGKVCWPNEEYRCAGIMDVPLMFEGCPYNDDK